MTGEHTLVYSAPMSGAIAPVVQIAGPYASGESIGGAVGVDFPCPIKSGDTGPVGVPLSLVVTDASKQSPELDVFLFSSEPTITGDANEFDPLAADALHLVTIFKVRTANWVTSKNWTAAQVKPEATAARMTASRNRLWACIVSRGTPTFTAADDLNARIEGLIN